MKLRLAAFVAGASGFIALSYEILWYRLYSFVSAGAPRAFGILLAAYLLGIALGSFRASIFCAEKGEAGSDAPLRSLGRFLFLAGIAAYLVAPALAYTATVTHWVLSLAAVVVATTLLGAVLPLVSHLAIVPDDRAGVRLSYLYVANIVGSASGSLLTGFVAMDRMSTRAIALSLGLASLALAAAVLLASDLHRARLAPRLIELAVAGAAMIATAHPFFDQLYERLLYKNGFTGDMRFTETVENRSGVINVSSDGKVWGGGAYDGAINTSLSNNNNWVVRAYAVPAMHSGTKRMLMIGLASGSWAQVLANAPGLEKFTVIEINPGYLELIARHAEVASILTNPKVEIVIDDGRRWLLAHPEARFDAIVMNTTWHWRAHASDLLSRDFLELARTHMVPGGLLFYNTTGSHDVFKTALAVYPYVLRVVNFVAVSDAPITLDRERWRALMLDYRLDGERVLDLSRKDDQIAMDSVLGLADSLRSPPVSYGLESRESLIGHVADGVVITDDNMACEWHTL
jgi:spermidine synthase